MKTYKLEIPKVQQLSSEGEEPPAVITRKEGASNNLIVSLATNVRQKAKGRKKVLQKVFRLHPTHCRCFDGKAKSTLETNF